MKCKHTGPCKQEHTYHSVCFQDYKVSRSEVDILTEEVANAILIEAIAKQERRGLTKTEAKVIVASQLVEGTGATVDEGLAILDKLS